MNPSNSSDANASSQFPPGMNVQTLENLLMAMVKYLRQCPDSVPSNSAANLEQRTPQPENYSSCTKSSRKQMTLDRWVCKAEKRSPLNLEAEEKKTSSNVTRNNSTTISLKTTETQTVNYVPDPGIVLVAGKVPNVAGQKLQYVCTPSGKYFVPVQGLPSNHDTYLLNINESSVQTCSVPQNVNDPMENSVTIAQNVELPEIRVMYPDSADGSNCATPIEITNSSLTSQFGSYVDSSELQVYSLNPVEGPKEQTYFNNLDSSTAQEKEVLQMLGQISVSETFISDVNSIGTSPLTADNLSTATPNYCDIPDLIEISNSDRVKEPDYVVLDKGINKNNSGDESRLNDTGSGIDVRRSPRQNSSVFKLKQFRKTETKLKKAEIEDDVTLIINSSPEVRSDEDTFSDRTNTKSTVLSSTSCMKLNNLEEKQNGEKTVLIQEVEFHEFENSHKVNNDKIESTEATASNIFEANDLDRTNQDCLGSAKDSYEHTNKNQCDSEATEIQDQNVILVNENDEVELMEVVIENNEKDICLEKEISEDSLECHSAHQKLAAVKLVLKRNRDAASKNDEETWDIMPGTLLDDSSIEKSTVIQDDTVKYSTHLQKSAKDLLNKEVTHCTQMDIRDLVERDAQNSYEFILREVLSIDKNHCPMHRDAVQYYQYPEKCMSSPYNLRKRICRTYRPDSITPKRVKQGTRHILRDSEKGIYENLKSNKTESVKVLARRKLKFNKNESAKTKEIQCTETFPEQVIKHESSSGGAESNLDEIFEPESEQTAHSKSPLTKLFKKNQLKTTKNKSLKTNPLFSEDDVSVREQNHENFIDGSISDLEGICKSTVNESVHKNTTLTEVSKQKKLKTNKNKTKMKKNPCPEKCTQVGKRDQDYPFEELNELEMKENTDSETAIAKVTQATILKDAKMKNLKLKTSPLEKVKQVRKPNCEDSLGGSRSSFEGISKGKKLIGEENTDSEEMVTEVIPRKELKNNQNKTLKIAVSPSSEENEVRKQRHNDSLSNSRSSFKESDELIVEENTNNEEMVTEVVPKKELRSTQNKTLKITESPFSEGNKVRKQRHNDCLNDSRSSFKESDKLIVEENTSNEETVAEVVPQKELRSSQIKTLKITVSPSSVENKVRKRRYNDSLSDSRSSFEESNKLIVEENTSNEETVTETIPRKELRSSQIKTLKITVSPSSEGTKVKKRRHNDLNDSRSSIKESNKLIVEKNANSETTVTERVQRNESRSSQNKTLKTKSLPSEESKNVGKQSHDDSLNNSRSSFIESSTLVVEENTDNEANLTEVVQRKGLRSSQNKTLKVKVSPLSTEDKQVRKNNSEDFLGSSNSSFGKSGELIMNENTDSAGTVPEMDQKRELKNSENKTLEIKVSPSFEDGEKVKKRNRENSLGSSRSSLEESNELMAEENTDSEATIIEVDQQKDVKNSENKTLGIKVSPSSEFGQKVREPNHKNSLGSSKSSLKENNELMAAENTDNETTVTEVNQEKDLKSRKNKTLKIKMSPSFEKGKKAGKRNYENFLGSSRSSFKESGKSMVEEKTNSEITVAEENQKKELKSSQNQTLKIKKPKECKQVRKENQKDSLVHLRTNNEEVNGLMMGENIDCEAVITDMVKKKGLKSSENKTLELKMSLTEKNKVVKQNHDDTISSSKSSFEDCSKLIEKNTDSEVTITEIDKKKEIKDSENETLKIKVLSSSEEDKKVRKQNRKKTTGSSKGDFEQGSEFIEENIGCKAIVTKMDHKKELKSSQNQTLKMKKPCKEDKQVKKDNQKDSLDHSRTDDGKINELMVGETTSGEATDMVRNEELNSEEKKTLEIKVSHSEKNKVRKRSHDEIISSSKTSFGESSKFMEENSDTETTFIEVDEKKELNGSESETLKIKVSPSSEKDTKVKKRNRGNSLYSSRDILEESSILRVEENTDSEATVTEIDQEKKLKSNQNKKLKIKKSSKEVEDKQTEKQILKDSLDDSRSNIERINEAMVGENGGSETMATKVVQNKELRSNSNKTLKKSHSQEEKEALTQNHADSLENDLEESSKLVQEKREETETMKITQEEALKSKNKSKNLKTKESLSSKESKLNKKRNHENTSDDFPSDHESICKSIEEENVESSTTLTNLVKERELESCKNKALRTNDLLSPSKDKQNDENINRNLEVTDKSILKGRTDNETVLSEMTQKRDLVESGENETLTGNHSAQTNDVVIQKSQGHALNNCENEPESTCKPISEEEITNSEKELIKKTSNRRYEININKSLKKKKMGSHKKERKQKWQQPNRSKLGKKIRRHLQNVNNSLSETAKHEQTNKDLEIKETSCNLEISKLSKPIPDSFKKVKHPKQTDLINEGDFESPSLKKFLNQENFLMKSESDSEYEWCEYDWTESDYEREIKALGLPKNKEEKCRQYIKEKFFGQNQEGELFVTCKDEDENVCEPYICIVKPGTQDKLEKYGCCIS